MNCARHVGKALLDSVNDAEKFSHTLIGRSTDFHSADGVESNPIGGLGGEEVFSAVVPPDCA